MIGDLNDYITYRLSRADITLKDAKMLADNDSWNSCVNRLYYSCFYAVTALLIGKGFEAKTHNGVKSIFFKEFIASGQIDKEFGNLYSDLIAWRSEGDYADFVDYDAQTVVPIIEKVEDFLKLIKNTINT
jgi:uncharacterized protein (UPF0332 family)